MLPGFRFLFVAVVLSVSMLIFGLGAAALLRATHEEFASLPLKQLPEVTFAARPVAEPTLAVLQVDTSAADLEQYDANPPQIQASQIETPQVADAPQPVTAPEIAAASAPDKTGTDKIAALTAPISTDDKPVANTKPAASDAGPAATPAPEPQASNLPAIAIGPSAPVPPAIAALDTGATASPAIVSPPAETQAVAALDVGATASAEPKSAGLKPVESTPNNSKTAESESLETKSAEPKSIESKTDNSISGGPKTAALADPKIAETKPIDASIVATAEIGSGTTTNASSSEAAATNPTTVVEIKPADSDAAPQNAPANVASPTAAVPNDALVKFAALGVPVPMPVERPKAASKASLVVKRTATVKHNIVKRRPIVRRARIVRPAQPQQPANPFAASPFGLN